MANVNYRIILLKAAKYSFTDEISKKTVDGCKVQYLIPDMPTIGENMVGYSVGSGSLPVGKYNELCREVPSICDGDFDMMIGTNGLPFLKLKDTKYVCKFPLQDLYNIALGEKGFEVPV